MNMSKAIDYINVAIVGDFERGYYVSKDDAIKAVEFERKEMLDKTFEWMKENIPKEAYLTYDGIFTVDWSRIKRKFTKEMKE